MKVLTKNGFKEFDSVLETQNKPNLLKIKFSDNSFIECTPEHKLLMKDGFVNASLIKINDITENNLIVTNIETKENSEPVYDLVNVKDTNHYITNNVTSHNCVFIDECIGGHSLITIRDKESGEIKQITIEEFYHII